MPFRKVTAFDGEKGYIDSIDEGNPMDVVEMDGKTYLVPGETLVLPDAPTAGFGAYVVVTGSPNSGTAAATDVKNPEVISRLVEKYRQNVPHIDKGVVTNSASEMGRKSYNDQCIDKGDDAQSMKIAVDGLIKAFQKNSAFKTEILKAMLAESPGEVEHFDDAVLSYFHGMEEAAREAGHIENANYISDRTERLRLIGS